MKITDIRFLNLCCVFILQFHRPLGLLYCFLVFHLRVFGKSWGKRARIKKDWGKKDHWERERCVWVLVQQRMEIP